MVDNFAGGGGASTGIWAALGRAPDAAINHDPEALAIYRANHPETEVYCEDVFDVDPRGVCRGRSIGLAWFSPDCCFFSSNAGCVYPAGDPLRTVTSSGGHAVVVSTLINTRNGERAGQDPRVLDIRRPLTTVTSVGSQGALVAAFLAKHYGGHETPGSSPASPVDTVTARDHHALVSSCIVKLKGTCRDGQPVTEPLATVQAQGLHYAEVRAFLFAHGAEVDEGDVVTVRVGGVLYAIVDIGMRMLTPRELYNAQGFPADYVIDPVVDKQFKTGRVVRRPLTKTEQVHKCGNAVPPPFAEAIARAQFAPRREEMVA